jgi:hypothetical protein
MLDNELEPLQVGELQETLDREAAGVRFDFGQTVLADRQFGGQCALRQPESAPAGREDLSQLGAVGQYLAHVFMQTALSITCLEFR